MITFTVPALFLFVFSFSLLLLSAATLAFCFLLYLQKKDGMILFFILFLSLGMSYIVIDTVSIYFRYIAWRSNVPLLRLFNTWLRTFMFFTGWFLFSRLSSPLKPFPSVILCAAGFIYPVYHTLTYFGLIPAVFYLESYILINILPLISLILVIRIIPGLPGETDRERKNLKKRVTAVSFSSLILFFFWFDRAFSFTILTGNDSLRYFVDNFNIYLFMFVIHICTVIYVIQTVGRENRTALSSQDHPSLIITSREKEIIVMLEKGLSNGEIAAALFISVPTVKTHLYNLYQKFGVKNRSELCYRLKFLSI